MSTPAFATLTDEQLMGAYAAGADGALEVLWTRWQPRLMRRLGRSLGDEAADVVQQTFLQIHGARERFRVDARFKPWILRIAHNLEVQLFRTRTRRARPVDPMLQDTMGTSADDPEAALRLREVLAQLRELPAEERELLGMAAAGYSYEEASESLGVAAPTLKTRVHRSRVALKRAS